VELFGDFKMFVLAQGTGDGGPKAGLTQHRVQQHLTHTFHPHSSLLRPSCH
jgi:hypothetical protein